ncbi:uncharacterized protein [Nicotiana sylvestris]|uniref:uncharacterized protein n=1 Tax=Nicotiana sylvestris TaxID=4096 RepID=UPI00388C9313
MNLFMHNCKVGLFGLLETKVKRHNAQVTLVYEFNDQALRRELWKQLMGMYGIIQWAWAVIGDFNCVLNRDERIGSPISLSEIRESKHCVQVCSLNDLRSSGAFYTWNNKLGDISRVYNKINRVLVDSDWITTLPSSEAHFGNEGLMDHRPVIINWGNGQQPNQCRFKNFNMWSQAPNFQPAVEFLAGKEVLLVKKELDECQNKLHKDPKNLQLIEYERRLIEEYQKWKLAETNNSDRNARSNG